MQRNLQNGKPTLIKYGKSIEIDAITVPDARKGPIDSGKHFFAEVFLKMEELTHQNIGVKIIFGRKNDDDMFSFSIQQGNASGAHGCQCLSLPMQFSAKGRRRIGLCL